VQLWDLIHRGILRGGNPPSREREHLSRRAHLTILLWALFTLALLYLVWRVSQTNWAPLNDADRALPDQIQRALTILAAAVVLLTSCSVRALIEGEQVDALVTRGWLLVAMALALVLFWLREM